ncbi:putative 78 kDa glucose-regulated protein-like protein [Hypsibius exemplaris]|uniref:78 kDa glucose-regulated protein-like protein n=1 Tax=Hypsibius exemplaris TaxID=2072580 RepID=A0A1W0X9J9_HYPEX|nr:putative 78 kDa glucose-regulated protein-like protein [Hypsibius exemplaris]
MEAVLGIDFGTAKICCAVWMPETGVRLLKTDRSETMVPTYVVKDGERTILGTEGRDLSLINTFSSVFDLSMYLGRSVTEANSLVMLFGAPFSFQGHQDAPAAMNIVFSDPALPVETEPVTRILYELLQEVKAQAEAVTRCAIKHCVVTMRFSTVQPQMMGPLNALGLGGLFVYDHDAALHGYLLQVGAENQPISTYVVLDVGASGSRISLYGKQLGREDFLAVVKTESQIGVRWLDLHVRQHCADQFEKTHGVSCQADRQAVHRLRVECENARKKLSLASTFDFNLEELYQGKTFKYRLTRDAYEEIIGPSVLQLCQLVTATLTGNGINVDAPDCKLLLVGGGSRIPLVKRSVRWVSGKIFDISVGGSADEFAAMGAAKLAHDYALRLPASGTEYPRPDLGFQPPVVNNSDGRPTEKAVPRSADEPVPFVEDHREATSDVDESANTTPPTGGAPDDMEPDVADVNENNTAVTDGSLLSHVTQCSLPLNYELCTSNGCAPYNPTAAPLNPDGDSLQICEPIVPECQAETFEIPNVDRSKFIYSNDEEMRQIFRDEKKVKMKEFKSDQPAVGIYPNLQQSFETYSTTYQLSSYTTEQFPGRLPKFQNQVRGHGTHSSLNSINAKWKTDSNSGDGERSNK